MLYFAVGHKHILQHVFRSFSVRIVEGQDNIFAADLDIFIDEAINDSENPSVIRERKVYQEYSFIRERNHTIKDLCDSFG